MARALSAYYRAAKDRGAVDEPGNKNDRPVEVDGKKYCVLKNDNGILAVYRITNAGRLKRLKRWPKEIDNMIQ